MKKRYQDGDYLFDGFAHRPFDEKLDGWRNAVPDPSDYAAVRNANAVLDLFEELSSARIRIWELEQEVARLRPFLDAYVVNS